MNAHSFERAPRSRHDVNHLIARLKAKVGKRLTREFGKRIPGVLIGRALNDAEELAASTAFPHLFFPALAEEKVRLVSEAMAREPAESAHLQFAA